MESPRGCQTVASVFQSFSERVNDGEIEPDFEYLVENGVTRVHRFFPVSSASDGEVGQVTSEAADD